MVLSRRVVRLVERMRLEAGCRGLEGAQAPSGGLAGQASSSCSREAVSADSGAFSCGYARGYEAWRFACMACRNALGFPPLGAGPGLPLSEP